jgi:glycosyltransferase involved in cell wall biosynthesis
MSESIRVALAITELSVGGAETCLTNLAEGLDRSRFEPEVYSLGPPPRDPRGALVHRLHRAHVPIHFLGGRHAAHLPFAVSRLRRQLQRQRPHILQTFLFHANVVGALAARRRDVGHVVAGLRVAEQPTWRWWLQGRLRHRFDRVVCVSQAVASLAQRRGGWPAASLVVIPNGVDLNILAPAVPARREDYGLAPHRGLLLYAGRLDVQKGVDWLLEAATRFLPRLPAHDLLIAGDGPLRATLGELASRAPLAGRVHFAPWQPDVAPLLCAADAVLLPSRWEGMSHLLLEAMACARPVLATNVEGVAEVLGDLAGRQVVPRDDTASWTARLIELVSDEEQGRQLGQLNQQRVGLHFSLAQMVSSYARLYTTLGD